MIIQLETGQKLEVPDGSTPAQIDEVIGHFQSGSPETPANPTSVGEYAGMGTRAIAEGLSMPVALPGNLAVLAANKMLGTNAKTPSQGFSELLTKMGLPEPSTPSQRVGSDVVSGVYNPINAIFGPIGYVASGMGSAGSGVAREMGGGTVAQLVAGLAAGGTPAIATTGIPAMVRGIMRGGPQSAQQMRNTIQDFQGVGTTPTVGQASQNPMARWMESALSKTPGSKGVILGKAETQADEMGQGVENLAQKLSAKSSAEQAGRSIEKGIKTVFLPNARTQQKRLYDELDQFIPQGTAVEATNYTQALGKLTQPIQGAKATSETKLLSNAGVDELKTAAKKDMGGTAATQSKILDEFGTPFQNAAVPGTNKLPYEALKEIRTRIGEKIENIDLAPDISKTELKQLYGALTKDMAAAAKSAGPEAEKAFNRANGYTRALHERLDILQNVIDKNGGPEKVFQAAISGTTEGATTFRAVMKSLPIDGKKMVTATILRRLGRASAGQQNELGDVFSSNTFLTNWNKLSPEAKTAMSGHMGPSFKADMDKIARVADNLKTGSKVYANPSGTAQGAADIATLGSFILSLFSGNISTAAGIAGAAGTGNLMARGMTNPRFVKWLAQNSRRPVSAIPSSLNSLNEFAKRENDEDTMDIVKNLQDQIGQ